MNEKKLKLIRQDIERAKELLSSKNKEEQYQFIKRFGKLKEKLAVLYPDDIEGYCDGKDAFVKALEKTALDWYRKNIEDRKIWKEK